MFRTLFLVCAALVLGACASNPPHAEPAQADALAATAPADPVDAESAAMLADAGAETAAVEQDPDKQEYCTREKRTGSRIPVMYCRTPEDDERNRAHSRGWLDKVKSTPQQSLDVSG